MRNTSWLLKIKIIAGVVVLANIFGCKTIYDYHGSFYDSSVGDGTLFSVEQKNLFHEYPFIFIDKSKKIGYLGWTPYSGSWYYSSVFILSKENDSTFTCKTNDSGLGPYRDDCLLKNESGQWIFSYATFKFPLMDRKILPALDSVQKKILSSGLFSAMSYYLDGDPFPELLDYPRYSKPVYSESIDSLTNYLFNSTSLEVGRTIGAITRIGDRQRKYYLLDGRDTLRLPEDEVKAIRQAMGGCIMLRDEQKITPAFQILRTNNDGSDSLVYSFQNSFFEVNGVSFKCKKQFESAR